MPLALNSTTIQVYWYPPPAAEQNGLITRYTLVYVGTLFNDSSSVDIYATATYPATSLRGPYNITGLQEYNNYSIEMRAVNAVGAGPFSTRVIQLTNQAGIRHNTNYKLSIIRTRVINKLVSSPRCLPA